MVKYQKPEVCLFSKYNGKRTNISKVRRVMGGEEPIQIRLPDVCNSIET